jgi:hypothetical protein
MKATLLCLAFAAAAACVPASAQDVRYGFGERPMRYGNTAGFFYDFRSDQRDFPTNGAFPGNFADDPFRAAAGGAGWLGSNPQHQARPYPSQSYYVGVRGRCPHTVVVETASGRRTLRCSSQ